MEKEFHTRHGALLIGLCLVALVNGCAHPARTVHRGDQSVIERFRGEIPKLLARNDIPGLALAVLDRDGLLWAEGFGYTDRTRRISVGPSTPFSVQSTSKSITATAVLIAVQEGLLDLDTPITRYIPEFSVKSRFGSEHVEQITIRRLLSHTAGLAHEAPVGNNYDLGSASLAEHVASISRTWLRFPVGQRFAYSNLGVDLAGYAIERASGEPFATYVDDRFFSPLGMADSTFDPAVIAERADRAIGHEKPFDQVPWRVPMIPAGGLYTSAVDLARYVRFHLNRGRVRQGRPPLLRQALLDEMTRIPSAVVGQEEGYALGVMIERRNGRRVLSHGGGGFGFLSDMIWYPDLGLGIVVLINATHHSLQGELAHRILDAFVEARVGGSAVATPQPVASKSSEEIENTRARVVGRYLGRGVVRRIEKRGDELFMVSGDDAFPLLFVSANEAFWLREDAPVPYRFTFTPAGLPSTMVRATDGGVFDYNDGPADPPGPDEPRWEAYIGEYRIRQWGRAIATERVWRRTGYLYWGDRRLSEHEPGLFFTRDGEALDLRRPPYTASNVVILRVP